MTSKILITLATLIYGIAPLFADLNTTHVLHPDWTPHSRLHMVWLLATNTSLAAVSLWLLWHRRQTVMAGVVGFCVVGGFWIAASTQHLYHGALADAGGIETTVLGLGGNAWGFGFVALLLVAGLALRRRD